MGWSKMSGEVGGLYACMDGWTCMRGASDKPCEKRNGIVEVQGLAVRNGVEVGLRGLLFLL